MAHEVVECVVCHATIRRCRCPGPHPVRYEVCDRCARQETPEEKARRVVGPLIPALPAPEPAVPEANPVVAVCGACGLDLRRVMGYVCPRSDCPTRPLGVVSGPSWRDVR